MPNKQVFHPDKAFIGGPYSPAVGVDDLVFISGQGPLDPETSRITGDTIEEQTTLTFKNVERALAAAGCTLDDVIKLNAYLLDMEHFNRFNAVYRGVMKEPYPARTTVGAVLWSGILVEIDVVAVRGCGSRKGQ